MVWRCRRWAGMLAMLCFFSGIARGGAAAAPHSMASIAVCGSNARPVGPRHMPRCPGPGLPQRPRRTAGVARRGEGGGFSVSTVPQHRKGEGEASGSGGGGGREVLEGGQGGSGTQKFVYQNGPDKIFPFVNVVFFPRESLWSGGGSPGGGGGGRLGTRPRYSVVCLWRRLLASHRCSF